MIENRITYDELRILQVYQTFDIDVIRFFQDYSREIEKLRGMDLKKIKEYLVNHGLNSNYISDYLDYIAMAKEVGLNLKNKKILYPNNIKDAHDDLYNQIEVMDDPVINKKIHDLSKVLLINKYEDENYVIFPASSIADLVEESKQQKNCVRTYCERVANNKSQIYFMRKKDDVSKSLVTIEVCNDRIVQAREKYNELPNKELNNILKKWEQNLIPIIFSELDA